MTNQSEILNENQPKQDFRFDVFISYRHAPLDSAAAAYLHKALENYKIPKEIQEKIGKRKSTAFSETKKNWVRPAICSPKLKTASNHRNIWWLFFLHDINSPNGA